MGAPAIILDRDGVLNENRPDHVKSWDEFRFLPGVLKALQLLTAAGAPIVVVTNQAIVHRQMVTHAGVLEIHERMIAQIQRAGARIDDILYCPHQSSEHCECRKPKPGLLFEAAQRLDLDLSRSVFIGDAVTDLVAGTAARCKTILVLTGRGQESRQALRYQPVAIPYAIRRDLLHAVPSILTFLAVNSDNPGHSPIGVERYDQENLVALAGAANAAYAT